MKYVAKKFDLTFELQGSTGESRVLTPREPSVNALYVDKVYKELNKFDEANKVNGTVVQAYEAQLKVLSTIYSNADQEWFMRNFTPGEIVEIGQTASKELQGVKKGE